MKILVLSWRGPGHPLSGGAEQSTWKHIEGWVKNGAEVTLFTSSFPGSSPIEKINGVTIVRKGDQYIGVKLYAYRYVKKNNFDLIIDEFHGIPFYTPLYAKKVICFIHEVAGPVWKLNPWPKPINLLPLILGPIVEKITLRCIYRDVQFITVSNSTKQDLEILGVKKIEVIHNGVTLPKNLKIYPKNRNTTFIFLSALSKDKGVEDVIEVFRIISKKISGASLLVVGKGEQRYVDYLKEKSKNLNVKFLGYVDENTKFELLSRSHVMLFPSFHEGWGLVVIEANSVGTPVVVFPVKGLVDSVNSGISGIISRDMTIESFAQSSMELINHKHYNSICKSSKLWAGKFNWKKSSDKSSNLIKSYLN